jgi:hypothetical protein
MRSTSEAVLPVVPKHDAGRTAADAVVAVQSTTTIGLAAMRASRLRVTRVLSPP